MRYPDQVNEALLNLLDSHDTERFLYTAGGSKEALKKAAAFLFAYKGMPCTYYGTEIGMTGCYDPGCRKGFDWKQENWDMELFSFYKRLIAVRKQERALRYGKIEFLIIQHRNGGHWGLPKGHVEDGESEHETAIREILEETSLKVKLIEGFRTSIEYSPKEESWKEVVFFIGEAEEGVVQIQEKELIDYRWVSYEESIELLTYADYKSVLEKAFAFLK
jgi:8-oxo-dGTP pyrophosphatase MutT (NUDIX family)